jgi:hypothetical protein
MSGRRRVFGAIALTTAALEAVRLSDWKATLRISVESSASPAALARLVRAVEREPEFVPGVRQVTLLARRARSTPRRPLRY